MSKDEELQRDGAEQSKDGESKECDHSSKSTDISHGMAKSFHVYGNSLPLNSWPACMIDFTWSDGIPSTTILTC